LFQQKITGIVENMARETSPYEGKFDDFNGRTALGKIVFVDIPNRKCRVKTIGLKGKTDDNDIPDVQWITTDGGDNGEEDTSIPKVGQLGVILYINHEPYILGYFRTLNPSPQDVPPVTPVIETNQGDRILKTIAGNSVVLRAGGSIEVVSTALCRTYWLPNNLISSVCEEYELETDGGFTSWSRDKQSRKTQLNVFIQDKEKPKNVIDAQFGTADNGNVADITMGEVSPNTLDFTKIKTHIGIDAKGSLTLQFGSSLSLASLGSVTNALSSLTSSLSGATSSLGLSDFGLSSLVSVAALIGPVKATLTVDASSGNVTLVTQGNLSQVVLGKLIETVAGNITRATKGNITETVIGSVTKAVGSLDVKSAAGVSISSAGSTSVKSLAGISMSSAGSSSMSSIGSLSLESASAASVSGKASTTVGSPTSLTSVQGLLVALAGGGLPVALMGSQAIGIGNLGAPVISTIITGSTRVSAPI
jgi:hypothetical protein